MSLFKKRSSRPGMEPVTRIELSEKNSTLRWVLAGVFLALGLVAIGVGLTFFLNTEDGWRDVEHTASEVNCAEDFVLRYDFGDSGVSATAENKAITELYSQAVVDAYRIFSTDVEQEGLYNLHWLNSHLNQEVEVDPALYRALELVARSGNRNVFLGEVYVEYDRIFQAESDAWAEAFDPAHSSEVREYVGQLAAFAKDPAMISLEALGENRVRLNVSEEYLSFAGEYALETFVDFGWMKNAFIADYIADLLVNAGYTHGYLSSYDGFTRNLDGREETYSINLFDRYGDEIFRPATMSYGGPAAMVSLRNYPMSQRDKWHYRAFADGTIATVFVDPADGMSKSATDNLFSYSYSLSCGEILLQVSPLFISDSLSETELNALRGDGIFSVWAEDRVLRYNEQALVMTLWEDAAYTSVYAG